MDRLRDRTPQPSTFWWKMTHHRKFHPKFLRSSKAEVCAWVRHQHCPQSKARLLSALRCHQRVVRCAEVLGCHIGAKGRTLRPLEKQRLKKAGETARRIGLLPTNRLTKLATLRACVLSRASYGWTDRAPYNWASKKLDTDIHKAAGGFRNSPPALRRMLEGGALHLDSVVGAKQIALYFRRLQNPEDEAIHRPNSTTKLLAEKWLTKTGWQKDPHHCRWTHDAIPNTTLEAPNAGQQHNFKRTSHLSREAWRVCQWKALRQSNRRELPELPEAYPMVQVSRTRKTLQTASGAKRFLLLGACCSPAVMGNDQFSKQCIWGCGQLGTWHHIAWLCDHRPNLSITPLWTAWLRVGVGHLVLLTSLAI